MKGKKFQKYLIQVLSQTEEAEKLEETIKTFKLIMKMQTYHVETRTDFFTFLSEILHFEGLKIFGLQTLVLLFTCLGILSVSDMSEYIPAFMPLFALAVIPALFQNKTYMMEEIEAVTRSSTAQIILAKLILLSAANLVSFTILAVLEKYSGNSSVSMIVFILYAAVPFLSCMVMMLRCIRLQKKDMALPCMFTSLFSCLCWGASAFAFPWLYRMSATGIWIIAFIVFGSFYVKEIYYIIKAAKEGRNYGIIN